MDWNGANAKDIPGVTTIREAFERYAKDYKIEVITDVAKASEADVVLLCVGEQAYAEWNGDSEDMKLCGKLGLEKNRAAIDEVKALNKPTVACILAGRQVILDEADYSGWDSVVMCYLPGSEGKGISDVLCGCADFKGKLPAPWYGDTSQIGTEESFLERGYGLTYGEGFKPQAEPETVLDTASESTADDPAAEGTKYTKGMFKDGVYVNDYAGIKLNVPGNLMYETVGYDEKKEWIDAETSEKEALLLKSQIYDAIFANSTEGVFVFFVNTNIILPDVKDVTEDYALDYCREWINGKLKVEWQERKKVKLGEQEFTRDVSTYDEHSFDCFYMKKLDDDLMCWVYVTTSDPERTPEYYEKLFS